MKRKFWENVKILTWEYSGISSYTLSTGSDSLFFLRSNESVNFWTKWRLSEVLVVFVVGCTSGSLPSAKSELLLICSRVTFDAWKELGFCNKLKFCNPCIFATWWCKPLIFQTYNTLSNRIHSLKYQGFTTLV